MTFPTGWGRKCNLVIQSNQIDATLANFPVLLTKDTLPSEMLDTDGSYPTLSGGGDIRFSSDADGNTQLACEIVTFTIDNNPANGKAEIWVKVPTVSSGTNTTFYVWYNKDKEAQPIPSSTYGSQNVWNDYITILHLGDKAVYESYKKGTSLWLITKKAQYFNGYIYFVLISSSNKINICKINDSTGCSSYYEVGTSAKLSGHAAPSVYIDINGYIYLTWSDYTASPYEITFVKSTNIEDITAWGSEETVSTQIYSTYPYITGVGTNIVVFWREGTAEIYKKIRTSGGTWGNSQTIFNGGSDKPYFQVVKGSNDRIHLAYHYQTDSYSFPNKDHDLYYAYSDDAELESSVWKSANGTTLSLPLAETADAKIYDTTNSGWDNTYILGISVDSNNIPHIAATRYDNVNSAELFHLSWNGSSWNESIILQDSGLTSGLSEHGDGDIYIDGFDNVYITFSIIIGSYKEIKEYVSINGGSSWSKNKDITTGSNAHNTLCSYPLNLNEGRLVFFNGSDNYDTIKNIYIYYNNKNPLILDPVCLFDTSAVVDSSGDCSIAKKATNEPIEATGQINKGQNFDGDNDSIEIPDSADFAFGVDESFTFEAWIKPGNPDSSSHDILASYEGNSKPYFLVNLISNNKFQFKFRDNGGSLTTEVASTGTYLGDTWYHIVGVRDVSANLGRLYLDGIENNSETDVTTAGVNPAVAVRIGRRNNNTSTFNGIIDEVRVSNTALSAEWIKTGYNNQYSPTTFVIEGTPSTPDESSIKSVGWVLLTDIKSIDSIAIANIKSINGKSL